MSAIKAGSLYTTSVSGINGIVEEVTKHNGRNVVRLLTLDGEIFSTVPRGTLRAGLIKSPGVGSFCGPTK